MFPQGQLHGLGALGDATLDALNKQLSDLQKQSQLFDDKIAALNRQNPILMFTNPNPAQLQANIQEIARLQQSWDALLQDIENTKAEIANRPNAVAEQQAAAAANQARLDEIRRVAQAEAAAKQAADEAAHQAYLDKVYQEQLATQALIDAATVKETAAQRAANLQLAAQQRAAQAAAQAAAAAGASPAAQQAAAAAAGKSAERGETIAAQVAAGAAAAAAPAAAAAAASAAATTNAASVTTARTSVAVAPPAAQVTNFTYTVDFHDNQFWLTRSDGAAIQNGSADFKSAELFVAPQNIALASVSVTPAANAKFRSNNALIAITGPDVTSTSVTGTTHTTNQTTGTTTVTNPTTGVTATTNPATGTTTVVATSSNTGKLALFALLGVLLLRGAVR